MPAKNSTKPSSKKYLRILQNGKTGLKMSSSTRLSTRIASNLSLAKLIPSQKKLQVVKKDKLLATKQRKNAKNHILVKDIRTEAKKVQKEEIIVQSREVQIPGFVRPKRKKFNASTPVDDINEALVKGEWQSDLSIVEDNVSNMNLDCASQEQSIDLRLFYDEEQGLKKRRTRKRSPKIDRKRRKSALKSKEKKERNPSSDRSYAPGEEGEAFCLKKAVKKLNRLSQNGITFEEFEAIFIPKNRKATFTEMSYFRIFEKYLEEG